MDVPPTAADDNDLVPKQLVLEVGSWSHGCESRDGRARTFRFYGLRCIILCKMTIHTQRIACKAKSVMLQRLIEPSGLQARSSTAVRRSRAHSACVRSLRVCRHLERG